MSKATAYADLRVKIRSYEKDGETKNVYATIGTLFATPHLSNMYINIDTLPINPNWDGRVFVVKKEDRPLTQAEVLMEGKRLDEKKPLDLSEIPF